MLEPGGEVDLAEKALGAHGGGELGVEHLDRDRPVVLEVAGEPDGGHAPAAELALERVAVPQAFAKRRDRVSHGLPRASRGPLHQLPEPRMVADRLEHGVDPDPRRRQRVRHREQRLQQVEGFLVPPRQQVDADELMLHVGAQVGVLARREHREPALALADRVLVAA